jgi:acetoin utilization protein AcuB
MNLLAPISTIMTKDPITIEASTTLDQLDNIFRQNRIHHLPVVEDDKVVGMISKSDFLLFKRGFFECQVEERYDMFKLKTHEAREIMTKGVAKLEPTDKINVALEVFKKNFLHSLLIMDQDILVGIVTTHDIIVHLAEEKSAINQYEKKW